jgi:hypothetical protein
VVWPLALEIGTSDFAFAMGHRRVAISSWPAPALDLGVIEAAEQAGQQAWTNRHRGDNGNTGIGLAMGASSGRQGSAS